MRRKLLLLFPLIAAGCQLNGDSEPQKVDTATAQGLVNPHIYTKPALPKPPPAALESARASSLALEQLNSQPDDIWQVIAQDFHIEVPDNERIQAQRDWYLKHPNYMKRISERAEPFLYLIVDKVRNKELPLELALLPIVESAFDPFAYSHGRASGLWQFIPGTAKRFGMDQNWWYDGRRDVTKSTEAALRYLSYLNRFFDGDWLHAIAAYNSGEGRVKRAIKDNKKNGLATDFWSLELPKETKDYVPKLLALADIIKHKEKYQMSVPAISNRYRLVEVNANSQIDLALAADMINMDVEHLQKLNPAYNRWSTPPEGPHSLLLPHELEDVFYAELSKLKPEQRLKWVRHKVVKGDTLGAIAKKYHSSSKMISKMNHLKGNMIRINQALLIPVASKELSQYSLSSDQRLAKVQSTPKGKYKHTHVVVAGDSFWNLSKTHGVNHRQLAKWNGMAPTDPLRLNQKLVIWKNNKASDKSHKAMTLASLDKSVMRKVTYKVRNGDSLWNIANKFKVSVADVLKWNNLSKKHYLQPGQKLKLYVDVTKS